MTRLQARAVAFDLAVELSAGGTARLPDDDGLIAWFGGQRRPRAGDQLQLDGRHLARRSPAARVRAGLVVVSDPPLAPAVSVVDHLAAVTSRSAAAELLTEVPRLDGRADDPAGVLSGGERRLLGWARALLLHPAAVVLDRAATGLDSEALAWATRQVERWRATGCVALVRPGREAEAAWLASP